MLVLILLLGSNSLRLLSTQIFTLLRLNKSSLPWQYGQLSSSAAIAASILMVERGYCLELDRSHDPLDPKLGDPRTLGNSHRAGSVSREAPGIIVATVFVLDDAHTVSHEQSPILTGRGPWNNVTFVTVRHLHRDIERQDSELSALHMNRLRKRKIDPCSMPLRWEGILAILNLDHLLFLLHAAPFLLPSRKFLHDRTRWFF